MLIFYGDQEFAISKNESVLDCLLRHRINIPFSCKSGSCQCCLLQAIKGKIPEKAQEGLKPTFKRKNLFLACQCVPENSMKVGLPDDTGISVTASILEKKPLNHNVLRVRLRPGSVFDCLPGQYLTLINPNQLARCYSIANQPAKDGYIELHIRLYPDGRMSNWLRDQAAIDDQVTLQGPAGFCFYTGDEKKDYPIVLAGTGTGLAPLYGILKDAIVQKHKGPIYLYHGALKENDLYLVKELSQIAQKTDLFTYMPCVLNGAEGQFCQRGNIEEIVLNNLPDVKSAIRMFLCGAPEFVNSIKVKAFLAGLASKNIHVDAFLATYKTKSEK